jgi:hypothetical protein
LVVDVWFTTTYAELHITAKAESSNPANVKVYSIQNYVITFVSDLCILGSVFSAFSGNRAENIDVHVYWVLYSQHSLKHKEENIDVHV